MPMRGMKTCLQHPNVPAVAACQICGINCCTTCAFSFPGNLHFCPDCALSGQTTLSPRRKKYLISSFILGGWSLVALIGTIAFAAMMVGDDPLAEIVLGVVLMVVAYVPSVIGTALGMSALRKGGPNPATVWIALILYSIILAVFFLLMLIGNFME